MKIHKRTKIMAEANLAFTKAFLDIEEKFELTYDDMYLLLSERMQRIARSSIQSERHPNDPDKGGDEA